MLMSEQYAATPPNITPEAHAQVLREQEAALLQLGGLYRDQQCVSEYYTAKSV
jgi:hypothetical protein